MQHNRGVAVSGQESRVARAALLLHGRDAAEAQKWMQGIGWRRNEDKKVVKACLTAFRAFPTKDATITEMAAYKRFVGHRLDFHICLESALACARGGWLSDGHVEAERVGEALRQFRDLEPLAGGEWIMQRTGLEKGKRLGRLKEWLWKLQIERGCETLEEMGAILDEIDWMDDMTRERAKDKLRTMKEYIGYPEEILQENLLEELYEACICHLVQQTQTLI